jgi:hypothetical protein
LNDQRFRAALAVHAMPARMPHAVFHGLVPLYTEVAVLLEHRGWQRGEPGGNTGRLARAGWAIAQWAHARLGRQRGKNVFREVESEFAMLVRSQELREIDGLDPACMGDVEECLACCSPRRK